MKKMKLSKTIILLFLVIAQLGLSMDFLFNTRDGMGIYDKSEFIEYTLGFPYSEIGFFTNIDKDKFLTIGIYGGVDFLSNSYQLTLKPLFTLDSFELSFPINITSRYVTTNEATEVGRTYLAVVPAFLIPNNFRVQLGLYYSALYLWYDPAFEISIPTFRTDEIFRAKFDFKVTYFTNSFSFSVGYNTSLRWLSHRSTFITSDNTIYFEGRFKIVF